MVKKQTGSSSDEKGDDQQLDGTKPLYPVLPSEELSRPSLESFKKINKRKKQYSSKEDCDGAGNSPDSEISPETESKSKHSEEEEEKVDLTSSSSSKKDSVVGSKFWQLLLLSIGLLVAVLSMCFGIHSFFYSKNPLNQQLDVKSLIGGLKSNFGGQPLLTYRIIETAIKTASSENPKAPGIILLLSSKDASEVTKELALNLVTSISEPSDFVTVDSVSYGHAEELKKDMDVTFQSRLNSSESQMKAVLLPNLDRFPLEAAMMLHSYCDHENAPFKRVVYVMTVFPNEEIPNNSDGDGKAWDTLATKHLKTAWGETEENKVEPLIARLTVSVAAVVATRTYGRMPPLPPPVI